MAKDHADHHDAEIVMRLYDLRREAVMRESRDAIMTQFWPRSYDEFIAVTKRDHELNRAFRQTGTFWEMAYGMVKHGVVNPAFFLESNGEGFFLYAEETDWAYRAHRLGWRHAEIPAARAVHAGAGTGSYAFIWAMAGENNAYTDLFPVSLEEL